MELQPVVLIAHVPTDASVETIRAAQEAIDNRVAVICGGLTAEQELKVLDAAYEQIRDMNFRLVADLRIERRWGSVFKWLTVALAALLLVETACWVSEYV